MTSEQQKRPPHSTNLMQPKRNSHTKQEIHPNLKTYSHKELCLKHNPKYTSLAKHTLHLKIKIFPLQHPKHNTHLKPHPLHKLHYNPNFHPRNRPHPKHNPHPKTTLHPKYQAHPKHQLHLKNKMYTQYKQQPKHNTKLKQETKPNLKSHPLHKLRPNFHPNPTPSNIYSNHKLTLVYRPHHKPASNATL